MLKKKNLNNGVKHVIDVVLRPNISALTLHPALHSASWVTANREKKDLMNQM